MSKADEEAVAAINSLAPPAAAEEADSNAEGEAVSAQHPAKEQTEREVCGDNELAQKSTEKEKELEELKTRVNFYQSAVQFISTVHKAVGFIESLLRSKTTSDVVEAIDFLVAAYPFQMEVAQQSVRRMLLLVWSKEAGIKDGVIDAYRAIFLTPLTQDGSRQTLQTTAQRLACLVVGASVGEMTSLERVMSELALAGYIPVALIGLLWDMFVSHESPSAGILLSLCASAMPKLLWPRLRAVLLSPAAAAFKDHPVQARTVCVMCQRLAEGGALNAMEDRELVARYVCDVVAREAGADDDRWLLAVEQALNALFRVHPEPHGPCGHLIRGLTAQVFAREAASGEADDGCEAGPALCESWRLARLLFVVGHAAVKQLAYLEGVAAAQARAQDQAGEGRAAKEAAKGGAEGAKDGDEEDLAAQVGTADAAVQETRSEMAREMGERELLSEAGLVGLFGPMLRQICLDSSAKYSDTRVRSCAILSLCKLMCVSSPYCEENLQLLFSIMMGAPEPAIRSNIVVALGDMAFRWTNLTEPWMAHIYALLRDDDGQVRTNTLTVLTHLVLNDMVKVRGQIGELALCLEDSDERIQDMARLFFSEFRHKQQGMLLYNLLPDMISRLSVGGVEEGKFRRVVKFVFGFVDKARQTDGLVDKLCQRFRATDVPRQWRDVAFCLAQLSYSEKSVRRLLEEANFRAFADKLHDEDIAASLAAVVAKAKKLPKGSDGKGVADELEARLLAAHENLVLPQASGALGSWMWGGVWSRVRVGCGLSTVPSTGWGEHSAPQRCISAESRPPACPLFPPTHPHLVMQCLTWRVRADRRLERTGNSLR
jgi:condensin complex subunit 1